MGALIKKTICIQIIFELIFTGLGYCGHDHDHGLDHDVFTCNTTHLYECECDSSAPPHTHEDEDDVEKDKGCHCSCLGGFIADYNPEVYTVVHRLTMLPPEHMDTYHYIYSPFIYHPPIG